MNSGLEMVSGQCAIQIYLLTYIVFVVGGGVNQNYYYIMCTLC